MPEITFKFKIGDIVIPQVILDGILQERRVLTTNRFPEGMRVVMRSSEECVAGTQLSYMCEPWNGGILKYAENSLVPINDAYEAVFELFLKRKEEKKPAETQPH